jgi:hypothetical protein
MEPSRITEPRLQSVLEELKVREPIFHRKELGTSRADFENMVAADYWEVGASGRKYSKQYVLDELEKRYAGEYEDEWKTSDFHCQELAQNLYLLTYDLLQGERKTRRSTIWRNVDSEWKIEFHQGTVIQD